MHNNIGRHTREGSQGGTGTEMRTGGTDYFKSDVSTRGRSIGEEEVIEDEHPETLEPFVHQVTGRSHMLTLNATTLCKSLLPRELLFYNSLTEELRRFTPEVKGVVYAQLEGNSTSPQFKTTDLFVKPRKGSSSSSTIPATEEISKIYNKSYRQTLFKGLERIHYGKSDGFTGHALTVDKDQEAMTEAIGANPWAKRQHQREINRMLARDTTIKSSILQMEENGASGGSMSEDTPGKFIRGYLMLEDVTAKYEHPNILDLKMGRQIERDDCSEEKRHKHVQLANFSSTGEIACRMAGMQVYQVNTGHYMCRDKYYGRGLSSDGFYELFKLFFHNGEKYLVEVIPHIEDQLRQLRKVIEKQNTFRFYASSLLITYEGTNITARTNATDNARLVDVRMIDFAHSTFKDFNGDKNVQIGPDQDVLDAIDNLLVFLQNIVQEGTKQ